MNLIDLVKEVFSTNNQKPKKEELKEAEEAKEVSPFAGVRPLDGAKTFGVLGEIHQYYLSPTKAAIRSWQIYNESDVAQIIINRYVGWIIGAGLRLESKPMTDIINKDLTNFQKQVESRFQLFNKSKKTSWNNQMNLSKLSETAIKNTKVGGDVLVHLYTEKERVKVRVIDTCHLSNNGVQKNDKGEHISYSVNVIGGKVENLKARDSKGRLVTWIYYGKRNRIDDDRGLPLLTIILESINSIDRYKTATITGAETRANHAIVAEHNQYSDGENPIDSTKLGAISNLPNTDSEGVDSYGEVEKQKRSIAKATAKTFLNLPVGASLKSIESDQEFNFPEFFKTNTGVVCAAANIPPEVAFMKYDSNFSASRAALKDWESSIYDERDDHVEQFLQPIFDYWLDVEIITGRISDEGYLNALIKNDQDLLQAYRTIRFLGKTVPHIDPLKEVQAERAKLGPLGAHLPLSTASRSSEILNSGSYDQNADQFKEELETMPNAQENNQQ